MAESTTQPSDASVRDHLNAVEPLRRREDALMLDALFQRVTGWQPMLWGTSIVGYGRYAYTYASGHSGQTLATGFAARKAKMVIYIMPGYGAFGDILAQLGPHKSGKSCLYLGALSRIDLDVLEDLIRAGLDDLRQRWPIEPT